MSLKFARIEHVRRTSLRWLAPLAVLSNHTNNAVFHIDR